MNKKEIYEEGRDRGESIASYQDFPEIGEEIDDHDLDIKIVEDKNDQEVVFLHRCWQAEENNRQFSPFEFTASDLNDAQQIKPYDVWDVYEEGIRVGFNKEWRRKWREHARGK